MGDTTAPATPPANHTAEELISLTERTSQNGTNTAYAVLESADKTNSENGKIKQANAVQSTIQNAQTP